MGLDNSGLCEWIPRNSWITANLKLLGSDSQLPVCRPSTSNGCWLMPVSGGRENLRRR
jgi:hypothetical protein